ncbi:MAG: ribokinase [Bryobacterales bacterium]|nr:ribokinase [Bryobacterales bacterium]
MTPVVAVLGSLNMDFVVSVETLPSPGQTVLGSQFQMLPGGKGANQACACGRLGAGKVRVRMAGRVGYDLFADHLKASLSAAGVDVSAVHATRSHPTGVALIWVDHQGQNSIVVASGANHTFAATDVNGLRATFSDASYALFQLETPLETVQAGLALARSEGVRTMLDPAPAAPLPRHLLQFVDILTPNESEASVLLGRPAARLTIAEARQAAAALRERTGVATVVMKLGEQGCFWLDQNREVYAPGFPVNAVDTTAAGDTFNAGLAVALAEGLDAVPALRFANAAAALSVTQPGAQASIPPRAGVERFLLEQQG